ncbi:hypothetical protein JCM5353_002845 [Sporobolomyces roseus]
MLVLSKSDVAQITHSLSAQSLCDMIGTTMNSISNPPNSQSSVAPIQNPQRISTESDSHKTLYMPSRLTTARGTNTAIKVVAVPKPGCQISGLPATTLLFDETTGGVKAVLDSSELTGIRTAAVSALATQILGPEKPEVLVVFGNGTQAYYHTRLLLELYPSIRKVCFAVRQLARLEELQTRLSPTFPKVHFSAELYGKATDAVKNADIICTCVPSTSPLFSSSNLKPGVHINAIGSYTPTMFEFPPSLISASSPPSLQEPKILTILVDSKEACLKEAGELIAAGIEEKNLIEIGNLIDENSQLRDDEATRTKLSSLRRDPGRRSLFKCVGVGGMDVAIASLVFEQAEKLGIGKSIDFS